MHFQLVSDLHLEFPNAESLRIENAGSDTLVLAGDITTIGILHTKFIPWLREHASRWKHVIYLMGNHEHYGHDFEQTQTSIQTAISAAHLWNVTLLEKAHIDLGDVVVLSASLWTDFNKHDLRTMRVCGSEMNDYRVIRKGSARLTPEDTYLVHRETVEAFKLMLHQFKDRKVAVFTHHSPSLQSVHPKYQYDSFLNGAYHSDLEWLMVWNPQIKLWGHGHTHESFDYVAADGACRVVCNPRGYHRIDENHSFDPNKILEV